MRIYYLITLLGLGIVALGCAAPVSEIDCHTDTECYEWAVQQGLPESDYP